MSHTLMMKAKKMSTNHKRRLGRRKDYLRFLCILQSMTVRKAS